MLTLFRTLSAMHVTTLSGSLWRFSLLSMRGGGGTDTQRIVHIRSTHSFLVENGFSCHSNSGALVGAQSILTINFLWGWAQSILTINFQLSFLKGLKRFSLDSNSAIAGAPVRIHTIVIKGKAYAGVNGGTGEVCGSGGKLSDESILGCAFPRNSPVIP